MSQVERLYNLLSDGLKHRTDEILAVVYGSSRLSLSRVAARINDIKKRYGVTIRGQKDRDNPKLYWYWIENESRVNEIISMFEEHRKEKEKVNPQMSFI